MQITLLNTIYTISIKINEAHNIYYENEENECQLFGAFIINSDVNSLKNIIDVKLIIGKTRYDMYLKSANICRYPLCIYLSTFI